jgi:predicted TIM-barrel fold metal-dependent hydrolase
MAAPTTSDAKRSSINEQRRELDRVDVHVHYLPDFYQLALIKAGLSQPDGISALPKWDEATAISVMDSLGVRTAMLSISSPGIHFGDDNKARALARRVNKEGARLTKSYPGRFGHFASVPLPSIEGSVEEAVYALDVLDADGWCSRPIITASIWVIPDWTSSMPNSIAARRSSSCTQRPPPAPVATD